MRDEIEPFLVTRQDEANGGLVPNVWTNHNGAMKKRGRTAGGIRDLLTMAQMKARMAALWRDGQTYKGIANQISDEFALEGDERLSGNGIHYHIKQMLSYWREKGLLAMDERQAMILARYDQLEEIAMDAYFASCEGTVTRNFEKQIERARSKERDMALLRGIKAERKDKKKKELASLLNDVGDTLEHLAIMAQKTKKYKRTESKPSGDPRWIQILIDINDKRAKLWGLHHRADMANGDQELARLPDEVREQRIAALLQQAQSRRDKHIGQLAPAAPLGGFEKGQEPVTPEVLPPDESWDTNEEDDEGWD